MSVLLGVVCVGAVLAAASPQRGRGGGGGEKPPALPPTQTATAPDGTRLAYDVTGTGPALLLVHGGGQTRADWHEAGYVERLAKQYTVITMDLRGHGESDAPETPEAYALDTVLADFLAVADAAGAKPFRVFGFGHGANIARYLAARSDRVQSAVLLGGNLGPAVIGLAAKGLEAMRAKWLPVLAARRAGTLDLETLSAGDRRALDGGIGAAALSFGALLDYPPLEPAEIKAPTLWIVGSQDATTQENVKEYESKLAGSAVTVQQISSGGYSDSFFRIDAVLALVEPFLASR